MYVNKYIKNGMCSWDNKKNISYSDNFKLVKSNNVVKSDSTY